MIRLRKVIIISILLGFFTACSKHPFSPDSNRFFNTPKALEDVELMALCLSGELAAPDNLYNQLDSDLESIRSIYGGEAPKVNRIKFSAPWLASCLLVSFDDATIPLILQGTYNAWDKLNATYRLKSVKTQNIAFSKFATLFFEGRLHPRRLALLYEGLPGVLYAEPNYIIGDGPNIYPRNTESGMTYLYCDGWGDCPAGCTSKEFWFFLRSRIDDSLILVGHWLPDQGPAPAWFAEARKNIDLWRTF